MEKRANVHLITTLIGPFPFWRMVANCQWGERGLSVVSSQWGQEIPCACGVRLAGYGVNCARSSSTSSILVLGVWIFGKAFASLICSGGKDERGGGDSDEEEEEARDTSKKTEVEQFSSTLRNEVRRNGNGSFSMLNFCKAVFFE